MASHRVLRELFIHKRMSRTLVRELTTSLRNNKADQDTVDAIKKWNSDNFNVYGPVLKTTQKRIINLPKKAPPAGEHSIKHVKDVSMIKKTVHGEINDDIESNHIAQETRTRAKPTEVRDPCVAVTFPNVVQNDNMMVETEANNQGVSDIDKTMTSDSRREQTASDHHSLDGILFFPMFPPDKTEFFVNPPEMPTVHIPGHTERSSFDNPFFPSVGTILGATQPIESKMALMKWRENLVKELGEEGFKQHRKGILDRGVNFHNCIQSYLEGTPTPEISLLDGNHGYWSSAQQVMKDIQDVHSVEQTVIHRTLCYRGQYDCVVQYRDELVLLDWKTSKKTKADIRYTYDNPIQLAAYVGANNLSQNADFMIDKALLVVCYEDGQPAHTHLLSRRMCVDYWSKWLQRLHLYWKQKLDVA